MNGNLDYADADAGPSVRDTVKASIAENTAGHSPDTEFIVDTAVEQRDRELRNNRDREENHHDRERRASDSRRSTIRQAIHETKLKAAAGPKLEKAAAEPVGTGPPSHWPLDSKRAWYELPEDTQLAVLRAEAGHKDFYGFIERDVKPVVEEHGRVRQALEPVREICAQHGLTDAPAMVERLVSWERRFRDPSTREQTFRELERLYGREQAQQYAPQQYYDPQVYDPQAEQQAMQVVTQFGSGKPHFEQVRGTMGALMYANGQKYLTPDGSCNLDRAYRDALRAEGLDHPTSRRFSSPRSRAPASNDYDDRSEQRRGRSVGSTIRDAFKEVRERTSGYY